MLVHPLVIPLVRTATLLAIVGGLTVLRRRARACSRPAQRVRTLFSMVRVAATTLSLFGATIYRFELVAVGLAVGVFGALALIS